MSKERKPILTDTDHQNMKAFLGFVLEDFKLGAITKVEAVEAIAHTVAAVDIGNYIEAKAWFEQGQKFTQESALRSKLTYSIEFDDDHEPLSEELKRVLDLGKSQKYPTA